MLWGGTQHEFGVAIQSLPARLAPVAVDRVLEHYRANHMEIKPVHAMPEMSRYWGDDVDFSLKLGRGDCAA
jgi:hypothetical protein